MALLRPTGARGAPLRHVGGCSRAFIVMLPKIGSRFKAIELLRCFRQAQDIDHIFAGIHVLHAARRHPLATLVVAVSRKRFT